MGSLVLQTCYFVMPLQLHQANGVLLGKTMTWALILRKSLLILAFLHYHGTHWDNPRHTSPSSPLQCHAIAVMKYSPCQLCSPSTGVVIIYALVKSEKRYQTQPFRKCPLPHRPNYWREKRMQQLHK